MRAPPGERDPAELLAFGVMNLDKPPGPTSHQVASWVRDLLDDALGGSGREGDGETDRGSEPDVDRGIDRAAHGGTLDPKVTGCLPVLTGDAVRLARLFDDAVKEYVAVLELHGPAPQDLHEVVGEFEGPIYQKPPRKSAVRRELRVRTVHELEVLEVEDRRALLGVTCESGTYVRKLCHDLGLALGTGANMGDLRRTRTGTFDDATLATLHDLVDALAFWTEDDDAGPLREVVQPAERVLVELPRVTIAPSAAAEVANGAPVYAPGVLGIESGLAVGAPGGADGEADSEDEWDAPSGTGETSPLVACYIPNGTAVCIGRLVGDPDADEGIVVDLERVLL